MAGDRSPVARACAEGRRGVQDVPEEARVGGAGSTLVGIMEFVDYYDTMGVAPDAPADEVKRAYRKLARRWHPDVSKENDAEARFKELGEAWTVLKDPERRAEYDALRAAHAAGATRGPGGDGRGGGFRPPPDWRSSAGVDPGTWRQDGGADFSDFFEEMFGRRAGGRGAGTGAGGGPGGGFARRGEDVESAVVITLEQAYAGATLPLGLRVPVRRDDGSLDFDERTLRTRIPAGTTDGTRLRLRGQGGPGSGGAPAGDLLLAIEVRAHERYTLDGRDVGVTVDLPAWDAALGGSVRVPTLGGTVTLRVPAGSESGKRLRLRGRGLPGEPPGDQYATLRIVTRAPAGAAAPDADAVRAAWEALRDMHADVETAGGTA